MTTEIVLITKELIALAIGNDMATILYAIAFVGFNTYLCTRSEKQQFYSITP